MIKEKLISICGIGPGNPSYISNIVWQQVEQADVLVGGNRQLEIFAQKAKKTVVFDGKTANLLKSIQQLEHKHIVVVVSGDTGFYSLRSFIKKALPEANIRLYPGISSFQYFYALLRLGYEKAYLASLHGKHHNYIEKLKESESVFLLTDRINNYKAIAQTLIDAELGHAIMHIGNNLSYPNEQIVTILAKEAIHLEHTFSLCSVIIENPLLK